MATGKDFQEQQLNHLTDAFMWILKAHAALESAVYHLDYARSFEMGQRTRITRDIENKALDELSTMQKSTAQFDAPVVGKFKYIAYELYELIQELEQEYERNDN